MLRSFDLMYIKMGIKRVPVEKQSEFVPLIVSGISTLNDTHAATLFNVLLSILPNLKLPERGTEEADKLKSVFGFDKAPEDAAYLSKKFSLLFLLDLAPLQAPNARPPFRSPGLTPEEFTFFTQDSKDTFSTASFTDAKVSAVRFLLSGAFSDGDLYFPLLTASHDPNLSVNRPAETYFKQLKVDIEDSERVKLLYRLFLGSRVERCAPVKSALQVQVLQILSKSTFAVNHDPKSVVFEALTSQYYRLVQTGFTFLRAITSKTEQSLLETFASEVLHQTKDVITKAGWPKLISGDIHTLSFRPLAYQAIGSLIRRVPDLLKDLKYFDFLLQSLEQDVADMKPSIQEALAETLPAIDKLSPETKEGLKSSLFKILSNPNADDSSKHIAVKVAVRSYHFSDATARLLCLLGLRRENRPDIIEEAKRGLHPYWFKTVNAIAIEQGEEYKLEFPDFSVLINLVKHTGSELEQYHDSSVHTLHGFPLSVYNSIIIFLERVFVMQAVHGRKTALVVDEDWDTRVETAIDLDDSIRTIVIKYISSVVADKKGVDLAYFLQLSFDGLELGHTDVQGCATIWRRILSLSPSAIVSQQYGAVASLVELLAQSKVLIRETAAFGLGIIISQQTRNESDLASVQKVVQELFSFLSQEIKDLNFRSVDRIHGTILSLGTIISRLYIVQKLGAVDTTGEIFETFSTFLPTILVDSKNLQVIDAALTALSQLAIFGALSVKPSTYFDGIKEKLVNLATKKDSEKAVLALGYMSLSDVSFLLPDEENKNREYYVEKIISFTQSKHTEYMFSSGEALSVIASGWNSKVLNRGLDIQDLPDPSLLPRIILTSETSYLEQTLETVLANTKSTKPATRKFACIWLISLLQYCGHLQPVQDKLEQIHLIFMKYLPESDELVQESASRGLSMIYEMGDSKLKDNLVYNLVQSFTADSSKKVNAGAVSEDTQLFEPGVLSTGDGSVSTYKDILNLASELGDPSLIYRFMSLAANSALWSSRKGAAFGLGSILSKANLDEMFENNKRLSQSLVPKLYRYRFDPNASVQQAMRGIWDALIKDKAAAIKSNFEPILKELLSGMADKEWRVRQASATALLDLLQGKPIELYQEYLEQIWARSFRAVDDIKESVRNAGLTLTRGLATSLIRYIDVDNGASPQRAEQILSHLVPFLMGHQGLQSDAEDIQSFALDTLIKLSKKGGSALKPFIPNLVEELLLLMSTLEPQAINYIALNADKYGLTNNAIDASRLASIRGSPLMEAIEQLIDQATDQETMAALVPRISNAVRKSVGLPSKVGASRVLVALCMRHMQQVAPFADTLLLSSQRQLNDRSDTISQSFAASCGYLCRLASDKAILKYIKDLQDQYFTAETERPRLITGHAVNGISKHAADRFQNLASALLPFVFIAKHDPEKSVEELFALVWSDNTGGSGAIRLYIKEILDLASSQLGSQQWIIRQVAAQSVANASNVISNDLILSPSANETGATTSTGSVNIDVGKLFNVLLEACTGRSWNGKELVLKALVLLASKAKGSYVSATPGFVEKLNKVVTTEAKRRNREYQVEALVSFGNFIHDFPKESLYDTLYEQADLYLDPEVDSDEEMSDAEEEDTKNKNTKDNSLGAGVLSKKDIAKEETRNKVLGSVVSSFVLCTEGRVDSKSSTIPKKRKFYDDSDATISKTCHYLSHILLCGVEDTKSTSGEETKTKSQIKKEKEEQRKRIKLGPVSWRSKLAITKHFSTIINSEYLDQMKISTSSQAKGKDSDKDVIMPESFEEVGKFISDAVTLTQLKSLHTVWEALLQTCAVDQNHESVRVETATSVGSYLALLDATQKASDERLVKYVKETLETVLKQVQQLRSEEKSNIVKTRLANVSTEYL